TTHNRTTPSSLACTPRRRDDRTRDGPAIGGDDTPTGPGMPASEDVREPALRLSGVGKSYSRHVAGQDLSPAVPRGGAFGLLGPNGAGKTTTLRMIMDVIGPDTGTIEILGQPAGLRGRDRIGYMPEERGLYPRMVVEEQLLFFAEIKGIPRKEASRRLSPWLERLGLEGWQHRRLNELSKGMQPKAPSTAPLPRDSEVLIGDEPLSGLDPIGGNVMRDVFVDLRRRGRTVVLSSHQMETVERLCDSIALINRGRKVLDGPVSEVKRRHGK